MNNMFNIQWIDDPEILYSLISNTYLFGVCFGLFAIIIALLVACIIKWQGYPDTSYKERRLWWIIIGIGISIFFALWNSYYCVPKIDGEECSIKDFTTAYLVSTIICLACFFIVSIITMLIFRSSKWGSILGPTKNK